MRAQRPSPLRGLLVGLWRLHHRCLRDGGRWRNSRGGGATLGGIVSVAEMGHPWQIATVAEVGSPLSGSVLPDIRAQLQDGAASLQDVRWSAVIRDATLNSCGLSCEGTRIGSSPADVFLIVCRFSNLTSTRNFGADALLRQFLNKKFPKET
jgi:hypothetical protein